MGALYKAQGLILKHAGVKGLDLLIRDRSKSTDLRNLAKRMLTGQIGLSGAVNQFVNL